MPHVVGKLSVVRAEGSIGLVAKFEEMHPVSGPRPKSAEEIDGCDPEALRTINVRGLFPPHSLETTARLGAGCALVVDDIRKLAWAGSRIMGNLRKKVLDLFDSQGNVIPSQGLVCLFRDGGASGTFWCADVCAGVPEVCDIVAGAFHESVEAGFHAVGEGVVRPARLVTDLAEDNLQRVMDAATREWNKLYGVEVTFPHSIPVELMSVAADTVNGISAVLSAEPQSGSIEVVVPLLLRLPEVEGGWRVHDTEHMELDGKQLPLNRRSLLIVPLEGEPSVMLGFGPDGLDPSGTIAYLEGSNLEMLVNAKVRSVLHALGWLP